MDDSRITSIDDVKAFLEGTKRFDLNLRDGTIKEKYAFIDRTVDRLDYRFLSKKEKKIVRRYIKKITGYRKSQLFKLVKRASKGKLSRKEYKRTNSHRIYQAKDIKLLEKTDDLHKRLSERATQEILRREHEVFHHEEYETIAHVSHGHVTNLRSHPVYRSHWVNHTKARSIPIGVSEKPENFGRPGSVRVDTAHQNDVYHISAVDEITQWQILFCVPQLSERCMVPAYEKVLDQFPFIIFNFHSDRGGEAINYRTAELLQRLHIKQTKSRSRRPNDNALAETKIGSVVRKNMGWVHINQTLADDINHFFFNFFNPYLNFHRPCGFPTVTIDDRGKTKKSYDVYRTPYDALRSLPDAETFLKDGVTFDSLDIMAYEHSDNQWAEIVIQEETKLFKKIETSREAGSNPRL